MRVFFLWLFLWDNLKTHSVFLVLPHLELSQHLWRALLSKRQEMCLTFPLLPLGFLPVWATEGFAGKQRCSFFFFFFNFNYWIFIRWWIPPQRSAKGIKIVCSQLSATDRAPNHWKMGLFLPGDVKTSRSDFPRQSSVLRADACQSSPR